MSKLMLGSMCGLRRRSKKPHEMTRTNGSFPPTIYRSFREQTCLPARGPFLNGRSKKLAAWGDSYLVFWNGNANEFG
jgi:hypothetical protein